MLQSSAKFWPCSIFNFSSHSPTRDTIWKARKCFLCKMKFICLYEFSPKLFLNQTPNTKHEKRAKKGKNGSKMGKVKKILHRT